jgi:hypothetical protein
VDAAFGLGRAGPAARARIVAGGKPRGAAGWDKRDPVGEFRDDHAFQQGFTGENALALHQFPRAPARLAAMATSKKIRRGIRRGGLPRARKLLLKSALWLDNLLQRIFVKDIKFTYYFSSLQRKKWRPLQDGTGAGGGKNCVRR